jgi:hypothetical protein
MTGVSMTFNAVLELYAGKLARTVPRGPRFREETWLPNYPTDPTQHVSHETIYTAIYAQPRGELRRQLIACAAATAPACPARVAQTGDLTCTPAAQPAAQADVSALVCHRHLMRAVEVDLP